MNGIKFPTKPAEKSVSLTTVVWQNEVRMEKTVVNPLSTPRKENR